MAILSVKHIDSVSPAISSTPQFKRTPPRPVELQEDGYLEKYDSDTVVYDACRIGSDVVLTCPPLLDLEERFATALSESLSEFVEVDISHLDRVSIVKLKNFPADVKYLAFEVEGWSFRGDINAERLADYAGKTVLFTKSKNNDLTWIEDWVKYHVANHGVNAVLLYDNGSTDYPAAEVLRAISVEGVDVATVVEWPFKFGPQGGKWSGPAKRPWDSDYCEYAIIEHARRKYLSSADVVIGHDIDELLVIEDGRTLQQVLEACKADYLTYSGLWIEDIRDDLERPPSFADYLYAESKGSPTTRKWVAQPIRINAAKQWRTHSVTGSSPEVSAVLKHRHFKGITTNWKWDRAKPRRTPSATQVVDYTLVRFMERAFGSVLERAPLGAGYLTGNPEAQHKFVLDIVRSVNPGRWSSFGLQRQWFWKPTVFVLEFSPRASLRFAIEIRLQGGRVSLVVTSRDSHTNEYLKTKLHGRFDAYGSSGEHWELDWWRPFVAAEEIATASVFSIDQFLCRCGRADTNI